MVEALLDTLATATPNAGDLRRLGLPLGPLELRRAWPSARGHLLLEYVAADGRIVGGQWIADGERLARVARATVRACGAPCSTVVDIGRTRVLLQAGGADRRLRGLAPLLSLPAATLVAHRPEKRAVLRLEAPGDRRYVKVVRSERARAVAAAGCAGRKLLGPACSAPELLEIDIASGVVVWSALPGVSLYELPDGARLVAGARGAGDALRALHAAAPSVYVRTHSALDEIGVLQEWLNRLQAFVPGPNRCFQAAAGVFQVLAADPSPPVLLHRDFYDKQIIVDEHGRVGLIDFDNLAVGEAALDLANALVHFELRALEGRCPAAAAAAARALLEAYRPSGEVRRRLQVYADAARLRLACVYSFRPHASALAEAMLARVGRPLEVGARPRLFEKVT